MIIVRNIFSHLTWNWKRHILLLVVFLVGCNISHPQDIPRPTPPPFNINDVEVMFWQNNQYLWVGNRYGIARIHRNGEVSAKLSGANCKTPTLTYDPEFIWCQGNVFDGTSWQMVAPNLIDNPLQASDKTIWAGHQDGLAKYDLTNQTWDYVLRDTSTSWDTSIVFNNPGPGIHLAMITRDGALWFYAYTGKYMGVNRFKGYEPLTWPMFSDDLIMVPKFEASDGSVWVVEYPSYHNKIARWDGHYWEYMTPFSELGVPIFMEGREQTIWVATGVDEVGQWNGESWQIWSPFTKDSKIVDIFQTEKEDIWVISSQNSIGRWNGSSWQVWSEDTISQSPRNNFNESALDSADTIPEPGGKPIIPKKHLEDSNGHIWVVLSSQKGIARWTGEGWGLYTTYDGLNANDVSTLTFSPDGVLWAGTRGAGVNYYDPETDRWQPFSD